jgi:hypothetical protein
MGGTWLDVDWIEAAVRANRQHVELTDDELDRLETVIRHTHSRRAMAPIARQRRDQARSRRRAGPSVRGNTTVSLT